MVKLMTGVNCINSLHEPFLYELFCAYFLVTNAKAVHKRLMKLTTWVNFTVFLWAAFVPADLCILILLVFSVKPKSWVKSLVVLTGIVGRSFVGETEWRKTMTAMHLFFAPKGWRNWRLKEQRQKRIFWFCCRKRH